MQSSTKVEFTLPADYQHLVEVSAAIEGLCRESLLFAHEAQTVYNITLAVHEICNNIVEHAYCEKQGEIQICLTLDAAARQFVADLYDTGGQFDPSAVAMPDLSQPQEEGYGLFLAHQLLDEVHYERLGQQNHWHLVKRP